VSQEASLSTNKPYPLQMVCEVWRFSKATCYRHRPACATADRPASESSSAVDGAEKSKRGPRPAISDEELLAAIRIMLAEAKFHGEGYRKVTARLRFKGLRVGKNRVLRLMRLHGLLAPVKWVHEHGDKAHKGTILTDEPERMWGTDAARFWTEQEGWCWWFGAIDHCVEDVVGWHVAKIGDRFAALEPIRQGVKERFGRFEGDVARGLAIRHDWGSQYTSAAFVGELRYLGIASSPAFVGEPECNGLIERFIRTLKEQCLYVHRFETLEQARQLIGEFIARYNQEWIIGRLGYRTPMQVRASYAKQAA